MKVKLILPALTEATSPFWRPIKYSLFPPLGLMTLAGYLRDDDEIEIWDEHIQTLDLSDRPELVVIEVYITAAKRAYEIASHYRKKGCYVAMGGLHITSFPEEGQHFADTIFLGPGEDTWPVFLEDFRNKKPKKRYQSKRRCLIGTPAPRRDLINNQKYLVPNSIIVSRGCPHTCDFCYKQNFFKGGKSFYTQPVDVVLEEISGLKGKHLYFLDDHLFGHRRFAEAVFEGMVGMNRLWQCAGTVASVLRPGFVEKAVKAGLRSLFIGFETLDSSNLLKYGKSHNKIKMYTTVVKRLHDMGVMVNASFIFGLDSDDASVFKRTTDWACEQGIETATFHILTPYPGTRLYKKLLRQRRILHSNWGLYDTRHAVYQPLQMDVETLEDGYQQAYKDFYRWYSICKSVLTKNTCFEMLRHLAYTGGWKKFEGFWGFIIKVGQLPRMRPFLEAVLSGSDIFKKPQKVKPQQDHGFDPVEMISKGSIQSDA